MIWRLIQDYPSFLLVMRMPTDSIRRRRSLWRLSRVNPDAYALFMQMYADSIQKPEKGRKSRKKEV